MIFLNASVSDFLGMIFFFPFIFYILAQLFGGISDSVVHWFRYKDYY